ncbi:MAG: hypothetical protein AAGD86_01855 [Pseudomonadota bacterium]
MDNGAFLMALKVLLVVSVGVGLPLLDLWRQHREERSRDDGDP